MKNKVLKNIKTIASYMLALLVIVSSFGFVPVTHATGHTLTIGSQTAVHDNVITVPITASITNIRGIQFSVNYPESILEYIPLGCSSTHIVCASDVGTSTNKINLTWYDVVTPMTLNNENLLSLQFKVLSSDASNTVLSFTPVEIINSSDLDVTGSTTFNSGTLTLNPASTIAIVTSSSYTIGANTITNVPYGTSKTTFLATLSKGQVNQTWNDTGINNPVVTGNTLVVTAQDGTTFVTYTVTVNAAPVTLSSIAITHSANKLSYFVGDTLDTTGLEVTGHYSDGSTQIETITASDVTGFDSSVSATVQVLTITFGGKTATYTVDIVALPELDVTAPIIILNGTDPMNLTVGNTFTDPGATASDNIDGNITTNIVVGGDIVDVNIVGTYIITYNVSDIAGNPAIEVTRTVNVDAVIPDTTSPVIEFHGDVTAEATSSADAVVNYTAPNATDNVDATEPAICLPASGSLFALGSTEVICKKTDVAGNVAEQTTFNIIVEDTTPPEITLNGDTVINLIVGDSYSEEGATASDIVDGQLSEIVIDDSNVDTSQPGSYSVTYNISDVAGNSALEVIRTVNVSDTEAPTIDSTSDVTTEATGSDGATVTYDENVLTATDDIDGVISVDVGSCIPVSGSTFALGTTPVSCSATDSSGNEGNGVAFSVIIEDTTAPEIILIGSTPIEITVGDSYSEEGATASDIVDGDLTGSIVMGGDVVDTSTVGTYVITYNVSDSTGNNAVQVTRTVIVNAPAPDTTAPVITLVGGSSMSVTVGNTFSDPGATALDNIDGNLTSSIVVGGSVDINTIGDYTLTYDVSDVAGNKANQVTRTVHVVAVVVLNSIAITTPANELSFTVGDVLNISGLVVTGTYSDATTKVEIVTVSNISGFDSSIPIVGQILTVTVAGKTTTYTINIVVVHHSSGGSSSNYTKPVALTLTEISGCDTRTTGFSTITGQSCITNISHDEGKVLGATSFNFTKFMKNGSRGNEVIELQKFLTTLGYTLVADGNFGPKTKGAVIKFQIANGLKGDGVVGALTRATLNK